jgi:AraC family transcriptional regulator
MNITIKKLPKMKIAYVRHTGPYVQCKGAWGKLCGWAGSKGLITDKTAFIGICHDDPDVVEPSKIRFDASITIADDVKGEGEVAVKEIKEDTYAMALHVGPYEKLHETYAYICGKWAPNKEIEIRSLPSVEIYKNDPENTPKEKLITEVYVPIVR